MGVSYQQRLNTFINKLITFYLTVNKLLNIVINNFTKSLAQYFLYRSCKFKDTYSALIKINDLFTSTRIG